LEEAHVRGKFPRYIVSAPGIGVLLPLEDDLRQITWASLSVTEASPLIRFITVTSFFFLLDDVNKQD
jgi:hypothetical protein